MSAPILPTDNPPSTTARKILFRWIERLMLLYGVLLTAYLLVRLLIGERSNTVAFLNNFVPWLAIGAVLFSLSALFSRWRWRLIGAQLPILAAFVMGYGDLYWPREQVKTPDGVPLSAATYNVLSGDSDPQQIIEVITALDADLVGLQELGAGHAALFQQELAGGYPYQVTHPTAVNFGLGLLSRYPIIDSRVKNYHDNPRYAILRAVVEVEGNQVVVYVAHLPVPSPITIDSKNGIPIPTMYDDSRHDDQLAVLRDYVREEAGPVLVVCDCNMTDQSDGYRALDAVLDDSFREVGRGIGFSHESHLLPSWFPKLWRIDYIWHDESFAAIRVRVNDENGTSDHYPVIAQLVLKAAAVDQAKRG